MSQIANVELPAFAKRHKDMTLDVFLGHYKLPFLLIERSDEKQSKGYGTVASDDTQNVLGTAHAPREKTEAGKECVFTVEKSERNTMASQIYVGRSLNNDIFVNHPAVSKLHATFRIESPPENYSVTDVGSHNGTTLLGHSLEPNRPYAIRSNDVLVLGKSIRATFLMPEDFFNYVDIYKRFLNI